jgi:hypothetical protein
MAVTLKIPFFEDQVSVTVAGYSEAGSLLQSNIALTESAVPGIYTGSLSFATFPVGYYDMRVYIGAATVASASWAIRVTADSTTADYADSIGELKARAELSINVLPGYITKQKAQQNNELFVGVGSLTQQALTCFNTDGTAQSLSGLTLRFCVSVEDSTSATGETAVAQIENANITVSGANSNIATFRYTSAMVVSPRRLIWSLRSDPSGNNVEMQKGVLNVGVSADV